MFQKREGDAAEGVARSDHDAERTRLFEDLRDLTPVERLAFRMHAKAEAKKAKREQRPRRGADR